MNRLTTILITTLIFGCNNFSDNKNHELSEKSEFIEKISDNSGEWNIKEHLTKKIQSPLTKLNLRPVDELNFKTLRIWRFPGGGAVFEQMLEFRDTNSRLTFHSYLIEGYENEAELSELIFSKTINEPAINKELKLIISDSNLLETEDSESYCESSWACADLYFIQFTNSDETGNFIINHDIENCDNEKAEISQRIFKIINQVTEKYSR